MLCGLTIAGVSFITACGDFDHESQGLIASLIMGEEEENINSINTLIGEPDIEINTQSHIQIQAFFITTSDQNFTKDMYLSKGNEIRSLLKRTQTFFC